MSRKKTSSPAEDPVVTADDLVEVPVPDPEPANTIKVTPILCPRCTAEMELAEGPCPNCGWRKQA